MQTCHGDPPSIEFAADVAAVIIVHMQGIYNISDLTITREEFCVQKLIRANSSSISLRSAEAQGQVSRLLVFVCEYVSFFCRLAPPTGRFDCLFVVSISADSGVNSHVLSLL